MKKISLLLFLFLAMAGCSSEPFEPFEFFFSLNGDKAVVISVLPYESGVEMRTQVYPEDGELGVGEVAQRDETRTLSAAEATEIHNLFRAVDFAAIDDGDYIPPLDASLWAVNTRETGEDYHTVLEPGEAAERRNLGDLIALGSYLWELADMEGPSY